MKCPKCSLIMDIETSRDKTLTFYDCIKCTNWIDSKNSIIESCDISLKNIGIFKGSNHAEIYDHKNHIRIEINIDLTINDIDNIESILTRILSLKSFS